MSKYDLLKKILHENESLHDLLKKILIYKKYNSNYLKISNIDRMPRTKVPRRVEFYGLFLVMQHIFKYILAYKPVR